VVAVAYQAGRHAAYMHERYGSVAKRWPRASCPVFQLTAYCLLLTAYCLELSARHIDPPYQVKQYLSGAFHVKIVLNSFISDWLEIVHPKCICPRLVRYVVALEAHFHAVLTCFIEERLGRKEEGRRSKVGWE
jgi:hypothetical protein